MPWLIKTTLGKMDQKMIGKGFKITLEGKTTRKRCNMFLQKQESFFFNLWNALVQQMKWSESCCCVSAGLAPSPGNFMPPHTYPHGRPGFGPPPTGPPPAMKPTPPPPGAPVTSATPPPPKADGTCHFLSKVTAQAEMTCSSETAELLCTLKCPPSVNQPFLF